ncbi:hypothetical protein GTW25_03475 [Aliihoeflea aestuarii]|jgi:hypothetical protein|uniref:DUF6506 family protein n=1 Tax=Aliihoeflea aestuarii TaxID=453840 RepID=UPI0020937364|nr:DUF6506 family protein [Aliihoeflea aestuarii]MCO6390084.1 hypothetical protein [Aliihoeflea aestuarii]
MRRAVFYEFHEGDPSTDRITYRNSSDEVTILPTGDPTVIAPMAAKLAGEGVGLIELCGGLPLAVRAMVKDAVGDRAQVASIAFGIESIVKAAEFNHAFMAGKPPAEACILRMRDADPVADRFVRHSGPQHTTFIMSGENSAAGVARELAETGIGLIELYGGFSDTVASNIIEVVAGRAAVGVSGFGHSPAETASPRARS